MTQLFDGVFKVRLLVDRKSAVCLVCFCFGKECHKSLSIFQWSGDVYRGILCVVVYVDM